MVHRKFVPVAADTGNTVSMRNITGTHLYPTAVVTIELDGQHYEQEVAVSNQLAKDALLGVDVSLWLHLIKSLLNEEMAQVKMLVQQEESSYAVTTQAQLRQRISSTHDKTKDEVKPESRADGEKRF